MKREPALLRAVPACLFGFGGLPLFVSAQDYNSPGVFEVTPYVANSNPGAWTATESLESDNRWVNATFEPFVWRTKWHAEGASPNTIILSKAIVDKYNTYREGLLDGADVRVYRVVNGQLTKVRTDKIKAGGYRASGWNTPNGHDAAKLIAPSATSAQTYWDKYNRPGVPYYFSVVAVDTNGNEARSATTLAVTPGLRDGNKGIQNSFVSFTAPETPAETTPPAAPTGLAYSIDATTGHLTVTWNAVTSPDLAGYRLVVSDYHPSEHRGYGVNLERNSTISSEHIRTGDMIFVSLQKNTLRKDETLVNRVWTAAIGNAPLYIPFTLPATGKDWSLVPHPTPIPSTFTDRGETCIKVDLTGTGTEKIYAYNHNSTAQQFYRVLDPAKTYVVEVWLRQENMTDPVVEFGFEGPYANLPKIPFTATGSWQKFTGTFKPSYLYTTEGQDGMMKLSFSGPGTLYVDNFRVYEQGLQPLEYEPALANALANSGVTHIRTHTIVRSGWSYSMKMLTNENGVMGYGGTSYNFSMRGRTLPDIFRSCVNAGVNPWLQIEMAMSESEWLGFVEYIAAPYDPTVDTPQSKPWAYKRYQQGRTTPWTSAFGSIYFELSNETWNNIFEPWCFLNKSMPDASTGRTYISDEIYGLFQEHVIGVMRSSPYWNSTLENKFTFVLGGWGSQINSPTGYGYRAAQLSPSSKFLTWADYNGGWENGAAPVVPNDEGYSRALTFAARRGQGSNATRIRNDLRDAGLANFRLGTYEAGPGYSYPGILADEEEESESRVMKSLAAGTGTLDAFLQRAYTDFDIQNFFNLEANRDYWSSHARWYSGGQAYPSWKALTMYNNHGTGNFLITRAQSVPTWDLPYEGSSARRDMARVYATRNGNRFNVFVVSRKLDNYPTAGDDGFTPVTIKLPFTAPTSITLHRMTGAPRAHNLDGNVIGVETVSIPTSAFSTNFVVNAARGADDRGLAPASVLLYVFEGVTIPALPTTPLPTIGVPPGGATVLVDQGTEEAAFEVVFSEPVNGFTKEDLNFASSSFDTSYLASSVEEIAPFNGTVYRVRVGNFTEIGNLVLNIPAGAAVARGDGNASQANAQTGNVVSITKPQLASGSGSTTIQATADSWVNYESWKDPANPGKNYGADVDLETGGSSSRAAYLRFNLIRIADRPVTSAKLRVYVRQVLQAGDQPVLSVADDTWAETEITALNEPPAGAQLGALSTSVTGWVEVDVTDFIEEQRRGDRLASLKLANGKWWIIRSRENSANTPPQLVVQYGSPVAPLRTNTVNREYWTGISGTNIASLTGNASFPGSPTGANTLSKLQAVSWNNSTVTANWAENYGQRIRGYIVPATTGLYTFWLASDDQSELWLSTDSTPEKKVKIAGVTGATTQYQYNKYASQKSIQRTLTAGNAYYLEILHKEGTTNDHLSVAWSTNPNLAPTSANIVPGSVLSSFSAGVPANGGFVPKVTTQPQGGTVYQGQNWTFTGAASGNPAPTFAWYRGTTQVGTGATLALTNLTAAQAGPYGFIASNIAGAATSDPATLTVITNTGIPGLNGGNIGTGSTFVARQLETGRLEQATNAAGVGTTSDALIFNHADITGDFQATLNLRALSGPAGARAGLMLRGDANGDSLPAAGDAFVFLGGGTGTGYVQRSRATAGATAGAEIVSKVNGTTVAHAFPDKWVRMRSYAGVLTLSVSSDNQTWQPVDDGIFDADALPADLLLGLATWGAAGNLAVSIADAFDLRLLGGVTTGLVGHWKLNDIGTTAGDSRPSGTPTSGTLQGNATWSTSGKVGRALSLDGTDDWVQIPDRADYDGSKLTVTAWVNSSASDDQPRGIVSKRTAYTNQQAFTLFTHTGGVLMMDIGNDRVDTGVVLGTGWKHVAMVFDGALSSNRLKLYVDGALAWQGNPGTATSVPDTTAAVHIGILNANFGYGWQGRIDEVRIFNRALSASEVAMVRDYEGTDPAPTLVNVALNAAATADSVFNTFVAANAVDGVGGSAGARTDATRWLASADNVEHWLALDFGAAKTINRVKFWIGSTGALNNPIPNYQLDYWNGTAWVNVLNKTGSFTAVDQVFAPVTTGKVRFRSTTPHVRLYELEVYGY